MFTGFAAGDNTVDARRHKRIKYRAFSGADPLKRETVAPSQEPEDGLFSFTEWLDDRCWPAHSYLVRLTFLLAESK